MVEKFTEVSRTRTGEQETTCGVPVKFAGELTTWILGRLAGEPLAWVLMRLTRKLIIGRRARRKSTRTRRISTSLCSIPSAPLSGMTKFVPAGKGEIVVKFSPTVTKLSKDG